MPEPRLLQRGPQWGAALERSGRGLCRGRGGRGCPEYVARGRGTNTGPFPPFSTEPTGKELINPPQACSLTFDAKGLVTKYTIGVVMDRQVGNTGGLGGLYGILYAIGKPLPFPEAQPWKMSKRYWLFQALGNLASRVAK